jgi:hypothetical protein
MPQLAASDAMRIRRSYEARDRGSPTTNSRPSCGKAVSLSPPEQATEPEDRQPRHLGRSDCPKGHRFQRKPFPQPLKRRPHCAGTAAAGLGTGPLRGSGDQAFLLRWRRGAGLVMVSSSAIRIARNRSQGPLPLRRRPIFV